MVTRGFSFIEIPRRATECALVGPAAGAVGEGALGPVSFQNECPSTTVEVIHLTIHGKGITCTCGLNPVSTVSVCDDISCFWFSVPEAIFGVCVVGPAFGGCISSLSVLKADVAFPIVANVAGLTAITVSCACFTLSLDAGLLIGAVCQTRALLLCARAVDADISSGAFLCVFAGTALVVDTDLSFGALADVCAAFLAGSLNTKEAVTATVGFCRAIYTLVTFAHFSVCTSFVVHTLWLDTCAVLAE